MSSLSTEAYPFTLGYVTEMLGIDENRLMVLCKTTGVQPQKEERSGRLFFNQPQLEQLRKMLDAEKRTDPSGQLPAPTQASATYATTRTGYASVPQRTATGLSRTELSAIVESVSNAKEEILKDLSQLLDDKLSGLDEVVVELIRSKSENDNRREEMKRLEETRNQLQSELAKYKPAAFGFYRKEGP